MPKDTSVNTEEIAKFDALSHEWWNENGEFKLLHRMNPARLSYIKKHLQSQDIASLDILDVGCGGGIVSIPMARMGAKIIGLDASYNNIQIAKEYAKKIGLSKYPEYRYGYIEELKHDGFDVILALEIIEHVEDVNFFISHLSRLIKPGGVVIISTIAKTVKSFLLAKMMAEYIMSIVPIGTHDWVKFVNPEDLEELALQNDLLLIDKMGLSLNVLNQTWSLTNDLSMNYIAAFKKR